MSFNYVVTVSGVAGNEKTVCQTYIQMEGYLKTGYEYFDWICVGDFTDK